MVKSNRTFNRSNRVSSSTLINRSFNWTPTEVYRSSLRSLKSRCSNYESFWKISVNRRSTRWSWSPSPLEIHRGPNIPRSKKCNSSSTRNAHRPVILHSSSAWPCWPSPFCFWRRSSSFACWSVSTADVARSPWQHETNFFARHPNNWPYRTQPSRRMQRRRHPHLPPVNINRSSE